MQKISIFAAAEIAGLSLDTQEKLLSVTDTKLMLHRLKQLKVNKKLFGKSKFYSHKQEDLIV